MATHSDRPELGDRGSLLSDVATGFSFLGRGMGRVVTRRRLFGLGLLPPLLTSILLIAVLAVVVVWGTAIITWATPFMNGWDPAVAQLTRSFVAVVLAVAVAFLAVVAFAGITLAIGAPFYDQISRQIERDCGETREPVELPLPRAIQRGLLDAAAAVLASVVLAAVVFVVGLVPVAGQIVATVVGALLGAWLVTSELLQPPFARRGFVTFADRRRAVLSHRAMTLGFGLPVYLAMLIPLLGILVFPGAVAGATLLARRLCAEPTAFVDPHDRPQP